MNTDAGAIVGALRERLGRSDLGGVRVAVVGAGGVARAAAAGLALAGASVEVFGRTRSKVDGLVRDLGGLGGGGAVAAGSWEGLSGARAEAVVHCTPVGMRGGGEAGGMAFDPAALGAMVFETVYAPVRTPLVEAAEAAGLGVIDGLEMFARQASAQSVAWTGAGADVSRMRRVAGDWLGE
jgi:shikimate 5-dehydrogenase